jgi:hypothetical protein
VTYFAAYGTIRSTTSRGLERLRAVQAFGQQTEGMADYQDQTVLSRLTTINQLSQVGRLVQDQGYLHGETLDYLSYAFIPRFLWPDKPIIQKGAWFAFQIGLANVDSHGVIHNSINMTIPGELYLNYGWGGVWIGLTILGVLISALWRTTMFWSKPKNTLGSAFAFYLVWPWIGFSLGADLQILVTLIAVYLALLVTGWGLPMLRRVSIKPRRRAAAAVSS